MARAKQLFSKRRIHRTDLLIRRSTRRGPERRGTASPAQAQSRGLERKAKDEATPNNLRPFDLLPAW